MLPGWLQQQQLVLRRLLRASEQQQPQQLLCLHLLLPQLFHLAGVRL